MSRKKDLKTKRSNLPNQRNQWLHKSKRTHQTKKISSSDKMYSSDQISPNPSLCWIASSSFCFNLSLLEYSGISNKLEHVRELGSISESEVCLSIMNFNDESPPTGVRSLPVAKKRKDFIWSWSNSYRISHNCWMIFVLGLNPPPYLAPFLNSVTSIMLDPHIIFSSSSEEKS